MKTIILVCALLLCFSTRISPQEFTTTPEEQGSTAEPLDTTTQEPTWHTTTEEPATASSTETSGPIWDTTPSEERTTTAEEPGTTQEPEQTTSYVPPITTTGSKSICSGHGKCKCDLGYAGPDCSQEVNWCQEHTIEIDGRPVVQSICGDRGDCVSSPAGARCICHPGFTGQFCDQLVPDELWLSKRCIAYNGSYIHSDWSPDDAVGCGNKQECVPDDLQCLLTPCHEPIGWCLPNDRARNHTHNARSAFMYREANNVWFKSELIANSSESCSGHGQCECDSGYKGHDCQEEVNWCSEPVEGFNQTAPIKDVCGPNGTCISQPSGATCLCEPGFTGEFCHDVIPSEVHIARRCYRYAPYGATADPTVPVGCSEKGDTCVPENIQCLLDLHCKNPIGWCIPLYQVDPQRLRMIFERALRNPDMIID
jgi:hypothetical protein